MNWNNLKTMECPKCGDSLVERNESFECEHLHGVREGCATPLCDFSIGNKKFDEVVNSLYKPKKFQSGEDRLSELNNFGRKEITEDFSDSSHLDY